MKKKGVVLAELLMLPIGLFIVFFILAEGFGFHSIPIIISQSMVPVVTGFGLFMMMNAGLMDFSMGARAVFAATIGGLMAEKLGIPGLILGCFLGAMFAALVMALLYYLFKIPAMVISLGILMIFEVAAAKLAGTSGYVKITKAQYSIGSYPYNIILMLVAAVICYLVVYKMQIGCHITAVGNDEKMCGNLGIKPEKVKFQAIMLTGVFCFFSALLTICYSGSITASTDMSTISMVSKPIMCVVLARYMRPKLDNMPFLILYGGVCISIIFNGFIAMGFDDSVQDIVLGLFLIFVLGSRAITGYVSEKRTVRAAVR